MNTPYTDIQLKQTLAKMLPETVSYDDVMNNFYWNRKFDGKIFTRVLDTELLHLCWLVEEELLNASTDGRWTWYIGEHKTGNYYGAAIHATWQQRTIALAKVKGIDIV